MKKVKVGILVVSLVVVALAFSGCGPLKEAAALQAYDFGTDKVPSINSVLGEERDVTAVETGTNNGAEQKQYSYKSSSVREDLIKYFGTLRESGWLVTQDFNFDVSPGQGQLATESEDAGYIIVLSVDYTDTNYAIKISKFEDTLTKNE